MAIYHLSAQLISRSQGRSVVACAAYRAAEKLQDDRMKKTHDYTRKKDVVHTEILLPKGAPSWMGDRATLWNHVEAIEKRKDAQLSREIQFSLPRELTLVQNTELARAFVQQTFVDVGMVADLSLHVDTGSDGQTQPHAHVLLSTRAFTAAGFGLKNTAWNKKEQLLVWREAWSSCANHHLALNGHDLQIDHRSNKDQHIDLEPQHKIGAVQAHHHKNRAADHDRIAYKNGQRLWHDPKIALDALTKQQSTFTHQDLARFVHRHTRDAEQFQQVYDKVKTAPELIPLGKDRQGRMRVTTTDMLQLETALQTQADQLHQHLGHGVRDKTLTAATQKRTLSEEQQTALTYIIDRGDLKCVIGYAGTGKSYLLDAAREVWESSGYRVRGVSLSGMATQNLQQSSGIESRTVASALYGWNRGQDKLTAQDILVIDEAGMLGSRQMERLLREAQQSGAKVVLVGDVQQLQAIEAGAAFRAITEAHHYVELTQIRRQESAWQRQATVSLAQGQVKEALSAYQHHDHVHGFDTQIQAKERLMQQWNDVRHSRPQDSQLILTYTRREVQDLNDRARQLKHQDGELGADVPFETERGTRHFAIGDRVCFLKKDHNLGVINGSLGTILDIQGSHLSIDLDPDMPDKKVRCVDVDATVYTALEHGYASTVHKAQGITVDRSYLLTSPYDDAHATYVALSRHRQSCDVFHSCEVFKDDHALVATLSRHRPKDITLDYTQPRLDYARQRAIEPERYVLTLAQKFQLNHDFYQQRAQEMMTRLDQQDKDAFLARCDQFSQRFRQAYPVRAKEIERLIQPDYERQALAYMKTFKDYHQQSQHDDPTPSRSQHRQDKKKQLHQETAAILHSEAAMTYLECRHPNMVKEMIQIAQAADQARQLEQKRQEHERTREHSYDFSR